MEPLNITLNQRSGVPLYEQICQHIRREIESHRLKPGTALPTSQELSTRLDVNYKTVHQAMATLAQEGYVKRQARRGTVVHGIPRRGVAAIYSSLDLLSREGKHEYYRLITGFLRKQLDHNFRVHRLYLGTEASGAVNTAADDLIAHLSGGTLCGVLLVNSAEQVDEIIRLGRQLHVPVVSVGNTRGCDYSVAADWRGFVLNAATFLREKGCRRIGVIYNSNSRGFLRPEQVLEVLKEAGVERKASWIIGGEDTEEGGRIAASRMPLDEIDGLIIQDDIVATGVDEFFGANKISIPGKLQVATYWNRGSHLRLDLPFEHFEMDVKAQAEQSLQLMQDVIDGRRITEPHIKLAAIHSSLITSDSGGDL